MESKTPTQNSKRTADFRLHLQQEFIARCKRNQNYSLRSFARSLGIAPSPLSAILRGKRTITAGTRQKLGAALGMKSDEILRFDSGSETPEASYQQLAADHFAVISDWYHYAILELIRTDKFKPEPLIVAKRLGISVTEVQAAVERLSRIGLLTISPKGVWFDNSENGQATNIVEGTTNSGAKNLQRQVLQMAIEAIDHVELELRDNTSMTMAVHPKDLPEARKLIKQFRRSMCELFEKNPRPQQVYHLGIALYPITNGEKK